MELLTYCPATDGFSNFQTPVETSTSPKSKCFLLVCRLSLRKFNYNLKLFYLSSLLCNLKNKYKNHLKRDVHEIISYTSLFAANQYNTVNILLTLHPSMLRNLPHRYELSQLSVHCKQKSFHLRHDRCKVFSSQCRLLSLPIYFRR